MKYLVKLQLEHNRIVHKVGKVIDSEDLGLSEKDIKRLVDGGCLEQTSKMPVEEKMQDEEIKLEDPLEELEPEHKKKKGKK